jgi:hypothetical protein
MALTLAEAAKLSNDVLLTGVVETIIKDSPVLQRLPFIEIVGNGLTYNREDAAPSAGFFDVGDTWTESTPTFTQQTVALKIMGGDADIDNFLIATRSNIQDVETAVVQLKAKAVQQLFEQTFVTGDEGTDPKEFDGLDELCDPAQTVSMGVNGGSLTLDKLDELIDAVKGGKPEILLMSRRSRRAAYTWSASAAWRRRTPAARASSGTRRWRSSTPSSSPASPASARRRGDRRQETGDMEQGNAMFPVPCSRLHSHDSA